MRTARSLILAALAAAAVVLAACGEDPIPTEWDPCANGDCQTVLVVELKGALPETFVVAVGQTTEQRGYRHEVACSAAESCGDSVRFDLDEPGAVWLSYESPTGVMGREVKPTFDKTRIGTPACPTGCREATVVLDVPQTIGPAVEVQPASHMLEGIKIHHLARYQTWLYAATDQGVYRRDLTAPGTGWATVGLVGQDVQGGIVIMHPDTLVAGAGVPYRSSDGGAVWAEATADTTLKNVQDMGLVDDTVIVAATWEGGRLFRSIDQGRTWTKAEEVYLDDQNVAPFTSGHMYSVEVDPDHPGLVWAMGESGFFQPVAFKSSDAARTWRAIPFSGEASSGDGRALDIAVDPTNPDRAWAGITDRLIRTETGGEDWRAGWHTMFLTSDDIPSVAASEAVPGRVWCFFTPATGDAILFVSDDGGDTWARTPMGHHGTGEMVAVSIGGAETLYVASDDGVFAYSVAGS